MAKPGEEAAAGAGRAIEAERIIREYDRRVRDIPADRYTLTNPAEYFQYQALCRDILLALGRHGAFPLNERRILDVGCGYGAYLLEFETWGASRANLAGIDLLAERADTARSRLAPASSTDHTIASPGADIRCGDASSLPWPDGAFDIVLQSMLISSVLDDSTRRSIASEMLRVTKPGGLIVWYDACVKNPWNPNLRHVSAAEVRRLFPGTTATFKRVSLVAPLRRALVPRSWVAAELVEKLTLFNSHLLGVLRRL